MRVMLQHSFLATHRSSAAFNSLCVTSYLIILSFSSLVNRFQIYNGFDAYIIPHDCSKPMLICLVDYWEELVSTQLAVL